MKKIKNIMDNKTPKVVGVGGIFFRSKDPKATKEWYSKNLGLNTDQHGTMFSSRDFNNPEEVTYLQWSPFDANTDYFDPSNKEFMINYRVQNIEGLVAQLKENGVNVVDEIVEYEYGKFVHIMDDEGNKIELWEPPTQGAFTNDDISTTE
ncbi:glyoxalase [marine bacterium AO1-C]|nr:glyoxalase [marine bacterium AO1-C]